MRNFLLVFISILIFPFAANADTNSCLLTKYENYSEAKSNYQEKLSQLVVSKNPEFTSIAKALTDAQQWRIEKNLISFKYFQKNKPDALKTDKIINRWLKSSDKDEQEIAASNSRYAELIHKIDESKQRPPNTKLDAFRTIFRNEIMQSSEFTNITSDLMNTTKKINETSCKES